MRASTWDNEWVYGLYESTSAAEAFVRQAEAQGVRHEDLVVLTPEDRPQKKLADILPERHHPEWKWAVTGAGIGFVLGTGIGYALISQLATGFDGVGVLLLALLPGFGGIVAGSFFGLQFAGTDASLNALYEESGAEGKVMVAIKCDPKRPDQINDVETLFMKSGVKPIEFPRIH